MHSGPDTTGKVLRTTKLTCTPDGGNHPQPAKSCKAIGKADGDFSHLARVDRPCTMIYQPVTVVAHGTWKDKPSGFARTYPNQCVAGSESGGVFDLGKR
ncbi:SSI family serine proteinase inhibitor [Streptomyces sp. NPDC003077]|uniref:SSI family serine proteinase inhibitor n=1 Tax=Streptomyces sp. NPDC003077 TaxID=3154443 RepID=UPI0033BFA32D